MRRIIISLAGGMFVMVASAFCWLLGALRFFVWVCAWPALLLRHYFREPAPDQIFPLLGGLPGIFTTLAFATLSYAILIYLVLWWRGRGARLS
jgi:hypothetical protein